MSNRKKKLNQDEIYDEIMSSVPETQKLKPNKFRPKTKSQTEYVELIKNKEISIASGPAGCGKSHCAISVAIDLILDKSTPYRKLIITTPAVEADEKIGFLPGPQPLDCKILTPNGWVMMGEIKIGDKVIGNDGKPANVIGVYPKGVKDVYEILTTNGGKTKACGEHLWLTRTYNENKHQKDWVLRNTLQIKNTIKNPNKGPKENHYLPKNDIVEFSCNNELPIPPYVLGVLLGDGSFGDSISFSSIDNDIINRVSEELSKYDLKLNNVTNTITYNIRGNYENNKPGKSIIITNLETNEVVKYERMGEALKYININRSTLYNRCYNNLIINNLKYEFVNDTTKWRNELKNEIHLLGLGETDHLNKFIPNIYKYTSKENRIALLQGLMDTDGTIKQTTGEQSFTTTSKQLCDDLIEVCRSLGSNATFYTRNRIGKKSMYKGRIIECKHISYEVSIPKFNDINPFHLKRKAEMVENKDKGVFHNKIKEINYIGSEEVQCIMLDNESHLYITDDYIITHNTLHEKLEPYMESSFYLIDKVVGKGMREKLVSQKMIEVEALGFIRGKNFENCIVFLEEAQNTTPRQMKTFLTRIGENAKFIISGDIEQSDKFKSGKQSGLFDAMTRLRVIEEIGFHDFMSFDIVRNPIVTKILDEYNMKEYNEEPVKQEKILLTESNIIPKTPVSKEKKENIFKRGVKYLLK